MPESIDMIAADAERRRIVNRLKRLGGQIRGLQTMIESGKECESVLTQVLAARSALTQVGLHIIGFSMKTCLSSGEVADRDDLVREAFDLFIRYRSLSSANHEPMDVAPDDSSAMLARLRELEDLVRGIENSLEDGTDCETVLRELSQATAMLGDVGLFVLGHSMRGCLIEDAGQSRDQLVDEAIAVFLKYSGCVT